jgi:RNA polymerase sigma factor (sigma-70 family)
MRDDPTVTDLVTRAREGDQQAWDALVERYAPLVWSVCRKYRLDRADAEDVGQTVWLRLVDQLARLRDPDALPGWLLTTTRRECAHTLDAARRSSALGLVPGAEDIPDSQAGAAERELLAAERRAARQPPAKMRVLGLEDQPVNEPGVQGDQSQGDEPGGHPLALVAMNATVLNPVWLIRAGPDHRSSQPAIPLITKARISQLVIQRRAGATDEHISPGSGGCLPLLPAAGLQHRAGGITHRPDNLGWLLPARHRGLALWLGDGLRHRARGVGHRLYYLSRAFLEGQHVLSSFGP